MIQANIRIGSDVTPSIDNPVTLSAIPPIGGHVTIIDRNSNHLVLRVEDVVIGAAGERMLAELPGVSQGQLRVTLLCSETFNHPMQLR